MEQHQVNAKYPKRIWSNESRLSRHDKKDNLVFTFYPPNKRSVAWASRFSPRDGLAAFSTETIFPNSIISVAFLGWTLNFPFQLWTLKSEQLVKVSGSIMDPKEKYLLHPPGSSRCWRPRQLPLLRSSVAPTNRKPSRFNITGMTCCHDKLGQSIHPFKIKFNDIFCNENKSSNFQCKLIFHVVSATIKKLKVTVNKWMRTNQNNSLPLADTPAVSGRQPGTHHLNFIRAVFKYYTVPHVTMSYLPQSTIFIQNNLQGICGKKYQYFTTDKVECTQTLLTRRGWHKIKAPIFYNRDAIYTDLHHRFLLAAKNKMQCR